MAHIGGKSGTIIFPQANEEVRGVSEQYNCPICHDAGFYTKIDEDGREVAVTCECHPAVKAHMVRSGAGKYSWMAVMNKRSEYEYKVGD